MGTTFAWNDKGLLEKLHPYKSQINRYEHNPASMSPAEAQRVKNEALAIATRRYQLTHARNVEMGCLYRKRFESMVEGWKKAWFY